jgi:hypothetical protein
VVPLVPEGGGVASASSGSFTPTVVGTYRWRAAYSGDSTYGPVSPLCNDVNESVVVTAPANEPPDCSDVTATLSVLKSNSKLSQVTLLGATDPDGDLVTVTIDAVTQDEPVSTGLRGDTSSPDATGASGNTVLLRGERSPKGDGRVYRIGFTASDGDLTCSSTAGPEGTTSVKVAVPAKKGQVAVDDGDLSSWNSFTGAFLRSPLQP